MLQVLLVPCNKSSWWLGKQLSVAMPSPAVQTRTAHLICVCLAVWTSTAYSSTRMHPAVVQKLTCRSHHERLKAQTDAQHGEVVAFIIRLDGKVQHTLGGVKEVMAGP